MDNSIWIRDWAPIVTRVHNKTYVAKAIYRPSYMPVNESKPLDKAGWELADKLGINCSELPLILDGGNITHNGYGTAIITKQIFNDNKKLSEAKIRNLLKEKLGLHHVIFIDKEWGDITGHVDGMVRFISRYLLVLAEFPEKYGSKNKKSGNNFYFEIKNYLKSKLGNKFRIIRIMNEIPENIKCDGIASAWGNRVNFLQIGKLIYLPVYGIPLHDQLARKTLEKEGFKVIPVRCDKLSRLGGVLNCITWQYP